MSSTWIILVAMVLIFLSLACVALLAWKNQESGQEMAKQAWNQAISHQNQMQTFSQEILKEVAGLAGRGVTGAQEQAKAMMSEISSTISQLVSPPPAPNSTQQPAELRLAVREPWTDYQSPAEQREAIEMRRGTAPPAGWSIHPNLGEIGASQPPLDFDLSDPQGL